MPWSQTSLMDQKTQFIADYLRDRLSVTELCARYGVSRKTGYKWVDRYLPDRSIDATAPLLEQTYRHLLIDYIVFDHQHVDGERTRQTAAALSSGR